MSDRVAKPIRVLLVDDLASVRKSIRRILARRDDIEVIAEAASGPEAVELAFTERPDVVLMDVRMPDGDGITATRALSGPDAAAPIPVIIMTLFDDDETLFAALGNGAAGFIPKAAATSELVDAIHRAARGEAMISSLVTRRVIEEFNRRQQPGRAVAPVASARSILAPREYDTVAALLRGMTNQQIADALGLKESTVKDYLIQVRRKTGAKGRASIMRWAIDHGMDKPNGTDS